MTRLANRLYAITAPGHLPLILGISFLIFALFYRAAGLPPPSEVATSAKELYESYGIPVLLIAAYLEGLVVFGFYLPGSFVILLSVYLAPKTLAPLVTIALTVGIGLLLAGMTNYLIGKYGLHKVLMRFERRSLIINTDAWMKKRGWVALPLSAALPNLFAVTTVCMGIAKQGIWKTAIGSLIGLSFWMPVWTVVASFLLKRGDLENSNQHWWIFVAFMLWALYLITNEQLRNRRSFRKKPPAQ